MRTKESKAADETRPRPRKAAGNATVVAPTNPGHLLPPPNSSEWVPVTARPPTAQLRPALKTKGSQDPHEARKSEPSAAPALAGNEDGTTTPGTPRERRRSVHFDTPPRTLSIAESATYQNGQCGLCVLLSDWVSPYDFEVYHKMHQHNLYIHGPCYEDTGLSEPPASDDDLESTPDSPPSSPPPSPINSVTTRGPAQAGTPETTQLVSQAHVASIPVTATAAASAVGVQEDKHAETTRRQVGASFFRSTPPTSLACSACSIRDAGGSFAQRRADLFDVARAIAASAWEHIPDCISGPTLPLTLARLALPMSDECTVTRILNGHPESNLYAALHDVGYCPRHIVEVLGSYFNDHDMGYSVLSVQ